MEDINEKKSKSYDETVLDKIMAGNHPIMNRESPLVSAETHEKIFMLAMNGNTNAMLALCSICFYHNPSNKYQSFLWAKYAFSKGNDNALFDLADAYEFGYADKKDSDINLAKKYMQLGVERKVPGCAFLLGQIYYDNENKYTEAFNMFKSEYSYNNSFSSRAAYYLCRAYMDGKGVDKNQEEAIKFWLIIVTNYEHNNISSIITFYSLHNLLDQIYDSGKINDNLVSKIAWYKDIYAKCGSAMISSRITEYEKQFEKMDALERKDIEIKVLRDMLDKMTIVSTNSADSNTTITKKRKTV